MFKFVAIVALASFVNAGIIPSATYVHEPVLTKVGEVVHSAPSAVSHQSITQVHHNHHVVSPVLAHGVKTTVHTSPVVHTAPVLHAAPVVHSAALVKTVHDHPIVHAEPILKTVHTAQVLHSVPVLKTVATPVVHAVHAAPVVHAAPIVKTYLH